MTTKHKQELRAGFQLWWTRDRSSNDLDAAPPMSQLKLLALAKKVSQAQAVYESLKNEYAREQHKLQEYVEWERVWLAAHGEGRK